ncbi:hypothetical protein M4I21_08205 [Cellulophaga sp. 20_2_10]|uniref:hypothetical protein n=1 Tax=Cellulophaga sp. 20_2_10 TaxID=2942476 RepID=UPI00201B2306|nr:hypothetical protein [Cellulophaga sp. 20_2_10]MCL5245786.1 hypothetical protein [Cellulophaga sp. 20_2_10]
MKKLKILFFAFVICNSTLAQEEYNYSDVLLTTTFKAYQEVDFQMANSMFPFVKERFLEHLKDSTSFTNPYDSLSKHISIQYSLDSVVKTYTWGERDSGCCHSSVVYAQYKTENNTIKYTNLKDPNTGGIDIFITGLHSIEINNQPHYLILGWGTCCGGKHHSTATVYKIVDGVLQKSNTAFIGKDYIFTEANRGQDIKIKYDAEKKILSYFSYPEDEERGFYKREQTLAQWKLTNKGFKKEN